MRPCTGAFVAHHLLIFDAAPQPFDEDVVDPAALAVHTDRDAGVLQDLDPLVARELRSLIGVEDLRPSKPRHRLLERFDAEVGRQRVREPCLLYTSPSPRDRTRSRMPSS